MLRLNSRRRNTLRLFQTNLSLKVRSATDNMKKSNAVKQNRSSNPIEKKSFSEIVVPKAMLMIPTWGNFSNRIAGISSMANSVVVEWSKAWKFFALQKKWLHWKLSLRFAYLANSTKDRNHSQQGAEYEADANVIRRFGHRFNFFRYWCGNIEHGHLYFCNFIATPQRTRNCEPNFCLLSNRWRKNLKFTFVASRFRWVSNWDTVMVRLVWLHRIRFTSRTIAAVTIASYAKPRRCKNGIGLTARRRWCHQVTILIVNMRSAG